MSQDPHDQLLLQIRGAVAEYERTLISERMRRGRLSKYRAGTLLPWTRPPYGYRLHPERPRDPTGVRQDPAEAAVVVEIYAGYLEDGVGLIKLAKKLYTQSIPSPTGKPRWGLATLRGILTNPAYTGQVYACRMRYRPPKIRRSSTHLIGHPHDTAVLVPREEWILVAEIPAIVSQAQFDLVQGKLAKNQSFASRHNTAHHYLLRALVSCGICQLSCYARTTAGKSYGYYVCSGKENLVQDRTTAKCPSRFMPAQQLDDLVWQDLCDLLTHPEIIAQAMKRAQGNSWLPQELQSRQENLRRGQVSLEQQLNRLTEAYLSGIIPLDEYERRRKEIEERQQALENQENHIRTQANRQKELAGLVNNIEDFCQRVQTGLADASFEQKRKLVELLIDRVVVTEAEVEIRYVIPTSQGSEFVRFCQLRSDYFAHPHLIWACNLQILHQVPVTRVWMIAIRGFVLLALYFLQQIMLPHQPAHAKPPKRVAIRCSPQLPKQPAAAIARKLTSNGLQVLFQLAFIRLLVFVVVTAAWQIHQLAACLDRISMPLLQRFHHYSFSFGGKPEYPNTFFAMSNWIVSRPIIRSSSATSFSCPSGLACSNSCGARWINSCFQRESTVSLIPYSRLASINPFFPEMSSSTTRALNSGLNFRLSTIVDLFPEVYPTPMGCVQFYRSTTRSVFAVGVRSIPLRAGLL
jgi:site-specific DNA recombinase